MLDAMLQYLHFLRSRDTKRKGNRYFNVWSNSNLRVNQTFPVFLTILKKLHFFVNQWFMRQHVTLNNDDQQDNKTVRNST